jgi:hypothetical protein
VALILDKPPGSCYDVVMLIPAGFAQVNLIFIGNAVPRGAQIVFGVENTTPSSPVEIAQEVGQAWIDEVMPFQSDQISLGSVKAKRGPNATGAEATVSFGDVGGQSSHSLPPNATGLVTKLTVLGGRKHKGRMNIPGLTENQTDGAGYLTPAALAALQGGLDAFLTEIVADVFPMVVLHSDATAPDTVTDLVAQQLMATQKRRIRRTGGS